MSQEVMTYDVLIVGAGPAGLAAAIHLKTLAKAQQQEISVCVIEKGAQIGSHNLSGAVLDPISLKELLPNEWSNAPLDTPVTDDAFYFLTQNRAFRLPLPSNLNNQGHYIISIDALCQFLASKAEALGCEIYPGFAATTVLFNSEDTVIGVATGDLGLDKDGTQTTHYQPGMHLLAKYTLFAEGCRGQLSERLIDKFHLRAGQSPQTYGLGIKEIWKVPEKQHHLGHVIHSIGWPLTQDTYGGSFIYHLSEQRIALGFVVGLDYKNPWLNPFEEMQRFKTHPLVRPMLENGERISYGARALVEGGWQSLPKLHFPGGALIGDSAGFINVAKIKGIHSAIKSGILAAKACLNALNTPPSPTLNTLEEYNKLFESSWLAKELYKVRNIRPGFRKGLWAGLLNAAFETYITHGHTPWTLKNHADYLSLNNCEQAPKIIYPKPDGKLTFDRLSSVFLTNVYHEENQPIHLKLKNPDLAIDINYRLYHSPETRYCPAGVYEIVFENEQPRLQINAQNCIHCKTCDIKDPMQNIVWEAPEGGGGPNYIYM